MRRFLLLLVCFAAVLAGPYIWMRDVRGRAVKPNPLPAAFAEDVAAGDVPADGGIAEGWSRDVAPGGSVSLRTALVRAGVFLGFLAAVGGLLVFLRRRGGFFPSLRRVSQVAVVDTLNLGSRHYLAVVEWEGRRFLVGITPQQISLIGRGDGAAGGTH
ncbi:MAG: flagellar biosynthetic protein FliO [Puniceicoccales bacterium]|nr:flagellar biosynthetic protein FliO [Puniceicoccales bacterium]